jgi:hypothetical protein
MGSWAAMDFIMAIIFCAGFGVIGVPYFSYDDEGCWWSRRYHRWVC